MVDVLFAPPNRKPTGTVVLVDVFRSSSTIVTALANGATCVIPFTHVSEAIKRSRKIGRSRCVLVGERNGVTPPGFDYNISPMDMSKENVNGKTILYSSTNLTRVLSRLRGGGETIVAGLVNAEATARYLASSKRGVSIIACGVPRGIAVEDLAGAGAIAAFLPKEVLSDGALFAAGFYKNPNWRSFVKRGRIATRLIGLGFARDVDYCLSPNISSAVPALRGERIVNLNQ